MMSFIKKDREFAMKSVGLPDSQQPFYDMQRENVSVYDVHFNHKHTEGLPMCVCVCACACVCAWRGRKQNWLLRVCDVGVWAGVIVCVCVWGGGFTENKRISRRRMRGNRCWERQILIFPFWFGMKYDILFPYTNINTGQTYSAVCVCLTTDTFTMVSTEHCH